MSEAPAAAVGFAKRSKNRANVRKRPAEDDAEGNATADDTTVVRKVKNAKDNSTFTTKKDDKAENFRFEGTGTLQQRDDQGATRCNEVDTEHDRDARAIKEKQLLLSVDPEAAAAVAGKYQGMSSYIDFKAGFRRETNLSSDKAKGTYGPLRSNAQFVRSTIRVDYQPDICKDYKETGYCGYGDACKFMHDRGDYKMGWELDREWEEKQKAERARLEAWAARDGEEDDEEGAKEDSDEEDDGLPFACWICRKPWDETSDPVVTKCGHHFCEHCALKHNAKSKKCAVCEQPTSGIFNTAHDIVKKTKAKKAKEAAAEAAGGGAS